MLSPEKVSFDNNLNNSHNKPTGLIKTKTDVYCFLLLLFFISFIYFLIFGNYLFFYQRNLSLFVYSKGFLQKFVVKPGGVLEYAGIFLTQGYYNDLYGSIILSAFTVLNTLILLSIGKKITQGKSFQISLVLLPVCLLFLLQTNINWLIHFNLGILLTLLFFLLSVSSFKCLIRIIPIVLFPLFFYLTGAYAWVFLFMYILYFIIFDKWIFPLIMLIVSLITFLISREFLFLQPDSGLLFYCLPSAGACKNSFLFYLASAIIITYPVWVKKLFYTKIMNKRVVSFYSMPAILILTIIILFTKQYDAEAANVSKIEKFLYESEWDKIIEYQEKKPSRNLVSQYCYNLALAEKGLLCDRMFNGPQDYGHKALLIAEWDLQAGIHNIYRSVYFFYAIGLVNEAQRWAFESMVSLGYRPENIKMLVKTSLINGYYKVAEKYIHLLKSTLHYRNWVKKYEEMLINPELIEEDPELAGKMKIQPKEDFPIRVKNPQSNLLLMVKANPRNDKAFEYIMAWHLLNKDNEAIVQNITTFKDLGYNQLPRHIQEAVFYCGPLPDLGGLSVSNEVRKHYVKYESLVFSPQDNTPADKEKIKQAFSNTYWYYYDFK